MVDMAKNIAKNNEIQNETEKINKHKKFHFDNIYVENPRSYEHIILYQIGDLSCESGYEIGEHKQYCYEISYIVSGKGCFYTNGRPYSVKKGDIYLSLPGEYHNGVADKFDPFRFFYLGFIFESYQEKQNPLTHVQRMFDQVNNPLRQEKFNIEAQFLNIFSEIINAKNYMDFMIKTELYQIIVLTYRNFFQNWEKEYSYKKDEQKSKQIVYEIINYIDANISSISDLSEIASELGYSYSYLSRVFTVETGLSIRKYYQKRRFEKAVELLKKSDFTITKIAEELQYQSIHSFSKAFRKNFGISPTEYQELYRRAITR